MFINSNLKSHLETSATVHGESLILAEINMNYAENFDAIGNYRYRQTIASPNTPNTINFGVITTTYDPTDALNAYTGATDSDVVIDGGIDTSNNPVVFTSIQERKKLLFSLEDCFNRFRPRSGINKAVYYGDIANSRYSHSDGPDMMSRPRYYVSDKEDKFKYWTSFRQEESGNVAVERGISAKACVVSETVTTYLIDDAAPFIVYKEKVPVNRIIVKMQTHVGSVKQDPINSGSYQMVNDPLFDSIETIQNRTIPIDWKIQYLEENPTTNVLTWQDAVDFGTLYPDGKDNGFPVISRDGYVELHYGKNGDDYNWYLGSQSQSSNTSIMTKFSSVVELEGTQHLPGEYEEFMFIKGLRIVVKTMSRQDVPFELIELSPRLAADFSSITKDYKTSRVASDLGMSGMPVGQLLASTGSITIADYDQVLNRNNQISASNPTGSVIANFVNRNLQLKFFEIIKEDMEDTSKWYYVPIKTLYAESFPEFDNNSRMATIQLRDMFFHFESLTAPQLLLTNVSLSYAVAMVMDSIGFSNYAYYKSVNDNDPIIPFFFVAPDTSVAQVLEDLAVSTQTAMFFDEYNNFILMSKRYMMPNPGDRQPNNPNEEVNFTLYGTTDFIKTGILNNKTANTAVPLSNIKSIGSVDKNIFNDGSIKYTSRYIQKSYGEIRQASFIDRDKTWQYKPVLLWEIEPSENSKSINEEKAKQGAYVLSAIPLNSNLSNVIPTVQNNQIVNNVMDLGEGVYWIPRYNGYFYANGEMIKFDAVEYNVAKPLIGSNLTTSTLNGNTTITTVSRIFKNVKPGQKIVKVSGTGNIAANTTIASVTQTESVVDIYEKSAIQITTVITLSSAATASGSLVFNIENDSSNVWINNVQEYQDYFAQIPFNGKMYPTGRVRIFAEPFYESYSDNGVTKTRLKNGAVNKHGRGQFNTSIVDHKAGIEGTDWTDDDYIFGMFMDSDYLFNDKSNNELTVLVTVAIPLGSPSKEITLVSNKGIDKKSIVTGSGIPPNTKVVKKKGKDTIIVNNDCENVVVDQEIYISGKGIKARDLLLADPIITTGLGLGNPSDAETAAQTIAKETVRTGIIKNMLSSAYYSEDTLNSLKSTQTGTVQSSALVMTGSTAKPVYGKPQDFIAYIKKDLTAEGITPKLFGGRLRIIGRLDNNDHSVQTPYGANPVATVTPKNSTENKTVYASSGGITFMFDETRSRGYFFEIAALTAGNIDEYSNEDGIVNVMFYKTVTKSNATLESIIRTNKSREIKFTGANSFKAGDFVAVSIDGDTYSSYERTAEQPYTVLTADGSSFTVRGDKATSSETIDLSSLNAVASYTVNIKNKAVPYKLWEGLSNIVVDDGKFTGQHRLKGEQNPSVYDLAVEYEDIFDNNYDGIANEDGTPSAGRKFYLYLNQKLIGTVIDPVPLPVLNTIGPFVRSTSKVMFENIYAIEQDKSNNGVNLQDAPLRSGSIFNEETDTDNSFRKYSVSSAVQDTYIKGISPLHQPDHKMYFEEFGTIMRESAYFNFRYDKAYPAFISKIAPTFNKLKGYAVAGYTGNAYGAEFLIFNTTDSAVNLDETSGNYLRILGVTFTQESDRQLTLDEYLKVKSDLSNPDFNNSVLESSIDNPNTAAKNLRLIKNSRVTNGRNEFSIDATYIQDADQAEELMGWLIEKMLDPRLSIGLSIFPTPTLQLGDIVTINYKTRNTHGDLIDEVADSSKRFVIYNIEYGRNEDGPDMTIYVSEVS
jgi:hypothetical protein